MNFEIYRPRPDDFLEVRSIRFTFQDIFTVVDSFYQEVAKDPLLKIPFQSVQDWPHHIDNLTHFWWTRFGGRPYLETSYNPVGKHYEAGFNDAFLERWLTLFKGILNQKLSSEQSDIWEAITISMGTALSKNNELMKQKYFR